MNQEGKRRKEMGLLSPLFDTKRKKSNWGKRGRREVKINLILSSK